MGSAVVWRDVRLWAQGTHTMNLQFAHPNDLPVEEPGYLIRRTKPNQELV